MNGLYIYPVRNPDPALPPCFKFGRGDGNVREPSHSNKFLHGWIDEHLRIKCFDAPGHLEKRIRDRLEAAGHNKMPIPMRATRAAEREREARTGNPRTAREVHAMNGKTLAEIIALVEGHIAVMVARARGT